MVDLRKSLTRDVEIIRRYRPGDETSIAEIFSNAIHQIACEFYTPEQCLAWSPRSHNYEYWKHRCKEKRPFVTTVGRDLSGFLELDPDGYIDCAYVNPKYRRLGIMRRMAEHAISAGFETGLGRVYVDASLCAKPLFEKLGFTLLEKRLVKLGAQELQNFRMELLKSRSEIRYG